MSELRESDNWWLQRDGQTHGPYSRATLAFILRDGRARAGDSVGQSPQGPWQTLGELVATIPPPPPVPVAAPPPPPAAPGAVAPAPPVAARPKRAGGLGWVLGILLFLAAGLAVPVVTVGPQYRQARAKAARLAATDSLQQIGLALEVYAQNHDGLLPSPGQWEAGLRTILTEPGQLRNPGDAAYVFSESLAGRPLREVRRTPSQELARDPSRYGDETLVLYADGKVRSVLPAR